MPSDITAKDKYDCAARELMLRKSVYPSLVARRKMSGERAKREIEVMAAIAEDYKRKELEG